jgi:exodeoxyribonuclease-3
MRLLTWNVNGLRAAIGKGLDGQIARLAPDVVLFQEIRCKPEQLPPGWAPPSGYVVRWHPAEKLGWSGVATWTRAPLTRANVGLAATDDDADGRVLVTEIGGWRIVNTYLPSGSAGPERQAAKDAFLVKFSPYLDALVGDATPTLVCGDLNLVPGPLDIHEPKRAEKLSGYLPHERAWFADRLTRGWVDVVRRDVGATKGPYTWWSNFGKARAENRGWRIDHVLANPAATQRTRFVAVDRDAGLQCSDHAPVLVDLD